MRFYKNWRTLQADFWTRVVAQGSRSHRTQRIYSSSLEGCLGWGSHILFFAQPRTSMHTCNNYDCPRWRTHRQPRRGQIRLGEPRLTDMFDVCLPGGVSGHLCAQEMWWWKLPPPAHSLTFQLGSKNQFQQIQREPQYGIFGYIFTHAHTHTITCSSFFV